MKPLYPAFQTDLFTPPPVKHYYNTVPEHGKVLVTKNERAGKQEIEILKWFQSKGDGVNFTAWECFNRAGNKMSMASVKRSLTNLMNDGYLEKTTELRPGQYGSRFPNRAYAITKRGLKQKL